MMASLKYVVFSLLMVMLAHHYAESMTVLRLDKRQINNEEGISPELPTNQGQDDCSESNESENDGTEASQEDVETNIVDEQSSGGGLKHNIEPEKCSESSENQMTTEIF